MLEKPCGSLPFMRPYHAEPADVWACGIIWVAMLAGKLPWAHPTADREEYVAWKDGKQHFKPRGVNRMIWPWPRYRRYLYPPPPLAVQFYGWCNKCFDILGKRPRKYIRPGDVGFIKFATV
jgi:serine/threonine protein kinase